MNLRWLKPGDWLAGVAGLVLLIDLFLPWYSSPDGNRTAWQAFAVNDVLLALVALGGIALAVTIAVRRTPALSVALAVIVCTAGALVTLLVLIRLLSHPDAYGLTTGSWIGLIAAAALTAGAWRSVADERNRGVPDPAVELRPAPPAA